MKTKMLVIILGILFFYSCSTKKRLPNKKNNNSITVKSPVFKPTYPMIEQKQRVKTPTRKTGVQNTLDYIMRFAPIAMREMKIYKIPASITLAQGILESGSGRSNIAVRSNNHFGIKCHKGWEGKSITHDDDLIGECFRRYEHPKTSYEDHSKFLVGRKRYDGLFKLEITDYKGWAYGLKRAGYATDKKYPVKLIRLIKKYNLNQYDLGKSPKPWKSKHVKSKNSVVSKGGKNTHIVVKGDTLYSLSRKYNLTTSELKKVNKLSSNDLSIGQVLKVK